MSLVAVLVAVRSPSHSQHRQVNFNASASMKKVYPQAKKVPACPRCEDTAAWKHDAKGRWWCKTCNKAFTPGITGANLNLTGGNRAHATLKKDQKQDINMRITKNKTKDEESSEETQAFGLFDNQLLIKTEDPVDTTQASAISARRLSKTQEQILEFIPSPTATSTPSNKIRKLTTRRASSDRYKQMFEEGDEKMDIKSEEAGDEQGEGDPMMASEEVAKPVEVVRTRSERPKKAPYACPHTDKPYYAKGKCRPCYWAEWRREGGKKGHAAKCAAEQQQQQQQQQTLVDASGTSPEPPKLNKRKKGKGSFGSFDSLPNYQKKPVAIDDAQSVAFKLNKTSDYQAIHELLLELRSFYITGEILKSSHLLLVVKRLTQNPSTAVSDLAKALFEEFAEILNEQRESGGNSPMSLAENADTDNSDPNNPHENKFLQQTILQQTNFVNNTNFAAFSPTMYTGVASDYPVTNFNNSGGFPANALQTSPMYVAQPSFQLQNQPNPVFTTPASPALTINTKTRRPRSNQTTPNAQSPPNKAIPFSPTHPYVTTPTTDPLATLIMTNNNLAFSPQQMTMPSALPNTLSPNMPPTFPGTSSIPPTLSLSGSLPMTSFSSPISSLSPSLPPNATPNQMRLVQEITMMNSALAQITNMNYSMLNNLNTMRNQNVLRQPVPAGFPAGVAAPGAPHMGQMYVTNAPNAYALPQNFAYAPMAMPSYVPYAAPYDATGLQTLPVSDMSSPVSSAPAQSEIDPAQLVESMLQHDDDVADDTNGNNYTLECTDYNHSPIITNYTVAGGTTDATAEQTSQTTNGQTTNPNPAQTPSGDQFTRDSFSTEMTNDSSCTSSDLELSDNYLTFLA